MKHYDSSRRPAEYRHPPVKVQDRRSGLGMDMVENVFFGIVMVLVFVFAVVILRSVDDGWTLLGAALIAAAGLYSIWRETKLRRGAA